MSDAGPGIPDVNVLVALTNSTHVFHVEAHQWLKGVERYATTPVTESGLVRMLLNPAVVGRTVTPEQALDVLTGVRADSRAEFLSDDSTLADADIDITGIAGHRQVTDWHLLNLAVRCEGVLITFDRRISRSTSPEDAARIVTLGT